MVESWQPSLPTGPAPCASVIPISGPTLVCSQQTVSYSMPPSSLVTQSPSVYSYNWYKPIPWVTIGTTTNQVYNAIAYGSGVLTAAVTSSNSFLCAGVSYTNFTCHAAGAIGVSVVPTPSFIVSNTLICQGECVTISTNPLGSFTCSSPFPNQQNTVGSLITVCPNVTTTYLLKAKSNVPGSNCTSQKSITIIVKPKPALTISPSPQFSFCGVPHPTVVFATPGLVNYTWSTLPLTPQTPPLNTSIGQFTLLGQTVITVTALAVNGCTAAASTTGIPLSYPNLNINASPLSICPGQSSTLTATGANTYTWNWPLSSNQNSVVVSPTITTVYGVSATGTNVCSVTSNVIVSVLGTPTVTVTPPYICAGITNNFQAFGAQSYTWVLGTVPQQTIALQSFNMQVNSATSYTVCGSGANAACIGCTTGILSPGNPIPIIAPSLTYCSNANLCTTISASSSLNAPVNYTWSSSYLFGQYIGASISVCPVNTATYIVSATSPSGCPNSATLSVSSLSNCCPGNTVGLSALNPAAGLSGTLANTSYLLNNTITLTNSASFFNSEVWMTPAAKIIVPYGMTLDFDNTHLFSCGLWMWEGIEVQDGGRVTTSNSSTHTNLIEDAKVAIDLSNISALNTSPLPPLDLQRWVFNKNFIGIRIANSAATLDSLALGISGCVFCSRDLSAGILTFPSPALTWPGAGPTCAFNELRCANQSTNGLIPPYALNGYTQTNLKQPYPNQGAHIGIQIKDIGDPNPYPVAISPTLPDGVVLGMYYQSAVANDFNLFDGLGIGIEVTNSGLKTMNNVFQKMQTYPFPGAPNNMFGGIGISHVIDPSINMNARLFLTGRDINDGNKFWDCYTGVFASNVYEPVVNFAFFRSTHAAAGASNAGPQPGDTGISVCTNRLNLGINWCQFNNLKYGMVISTPSNSSGYDIGYGPTPGICIRGFEIQSNYFGPEVNSSTPNTGTEYMSDAIQIISPNINNWAFQPNTVGSVLVSNKINRTYRGILLDGFADTQIDMIGNDVGIDADYTFGNPSWGYGISLNNNFGNLTVSNNTLHASKPWVNYPMPTPTISLLFAENNYSATTKSPRIECNFAKNAYIGYHFSGPNDGTVWEGNEMCSNFYGMALTNSAVIGEQGSPTSAIGNWWRQSSLLGCDAWNGGNAAAWQTYCEDSDPNLSKLWVINVSPNYNPLYNVGNQIGITYLTGTSPNIDLAPINRLSDCTGNHIYGPPPAWRLTNLNEDESNETVSQIRIYPNPSSDQFILESLENMTGSTLFVYSISGVELLRRSVLEDYKVQIDISEFQPALYFIQLK
ncbi:MAG TPA: T9SS type A sorting domain-containing protein, partial [Bacteroidia bacterium]|nr:T9SS type A sorting domain-containing protein [Bacteroidia bacterium]